jgi:hypothetical protein
MLSRDIGFRVSTFNSRTNASQLGSISEPVIAFAGATVTIARTVNTEFSLFEFAENET